VRRNSRFVLSNKRRPDTVPGRVLSDLERREEALAAVEKAVEIYRGLAETRPDAFLPDLAMSLNSLSNCLSDLDRTQEALAVIDEAVAIHRGLAEARPDTFLPNLSMSLNNRSGCLSGLGRREEALGAIEEAVRVILPMLEIAPYVLPDSGFRLVLRYLECLEALDRAPDEELLGRMISVLTTAGVIDPEVGGSQATDT
jgi:tetratricopeptide (TPR) repeat protein